MKYLGFISIAMLLAIGACSKTEQGAGAPKEAAPAAAPSATEAAPMAGAMTESAEKDKKPADAPAAAQ